jgi:hypothetical protein
MLVASKVRYEANLSAASHLGERPESALKRHPAKEYLGRNEDVAIVNF